MACANKLVEVYNKLKAMGHEPLMHSDVFGIVRGDAPELLCDDGREHAEIKRKYNYIKAWYDIILSGDALLVCNFDKNGIKNYIGGNTLMEIGFAYVNNKKVFLLNPIPENVSYVDEIKAMVDVVLNGDLTQI
ncbi:MAG: hypothetical protein PHV78_03830 [Patescibacteria group bacterium]|nr:hypothetical protein [Patescibacteria group bacterium]MDD5121484.1 hypothetical protein [Patescibacteria group bacterium]MDD5221956.1 hypothetical protein [Patescibacteria group bacterium]MDD5396354.1 hypothetical protein [Patescibacteria group bacterium]